MVLVRDCDLTSKRWDVLALPGVEITHVPKEDIARLAREARKLGAKVVNVHGETVSEPVEPGTNLAAVRSPDVDVLAHPGLITDDEARIAAANGVLLEVSARRSHAYANGHVVRVAQRAGASLVLNSDAHAPGRPADEGLRHPRGAGSGTGQRTGRRSPRARTRRSAPQDRSRPLAGCDWSEHPQPYTPSIWTNICRDQELKHPPGADYAEGINIELWMDEGSSYAPSYGDAFVDALVDWLLSQEYLRLLGHIA